MIALIALFGLLFQQLAMAAYVCPMEGGDVASASATAELAPCRSPDMTDKARCQQHCHPLAQTSDQAAALTVPPAVLPATTWSRDFRATHVDLPRRIACDVDRRATAPPLNIQHCTFQI